MIQRKLKILCLSVIMLFSSLGLAADELSTDLSLDDQFSADTNQPAPAPSQAPTPMDEFTTSPDPMMDLSASQDLNVQNDDQSENVNLASPIELRQRENALFGFSAGIMISSQPYHENYDIGSTSGGFIIRTDKINRQTEPVQNVGVILRYAVAPFYGLGTDLNISYSRSQNHSLITVRETHTLSEVTNLKGEVNFAYAIEFGKVPIYFLAGLGAEKTTGSEVEAIMQAMGYGGQVGAGFAINSTLNLEGLYSYYRHRLSDNVINESASGAAPKIISADSAEVVVQGLIVRGTYSFNF